MSQPSKEELLEELYTLSKKYSRIRQIISKPIYACGEEMFGKNCHGIYFTDETYKELKKLLED